VATLVKSYIGYRAKSNVNPPHLADALPGGWPAIGFASAKIRIRLRGRWDRIVESIREDIDDHCRYASFRKLIDAGRFDLTVLTVFKQNAGKKEAGEKQRGWYHVSGVCRESFVDRRCVVRIGSSSCLDADGSPAAALCTTC